MESTSKSPLAAQLSAWQRGINAELNFWRIWFETKGLHWPDEYERRLRNDTIFPGQFLDGLGDTPRVLDVGSGPLTLLGKQHNGRDIDITACDPLAPYYSEFAVKHGVSVPVPVKQAFAEDLSFFFDPGSFDLVYCANALDHSFDPIRGIEEMLIVARLGGRIILQHATNEAEYEKYVGFHQWNFDEEDGHFIIWDKSRRIDASALFGANAEISVHKKDRSLMVTFQKTSELACDRLTRSQGRVKELLLAFLSVGAAFGQPQSTS